MQGLGGFFYENNTRFWSEATPNIQQNHAFAVPVQTLTHINIHELEVILLTMETWGERWAQAELILFTDSGTAFNGLMHHTLRGNANIALRKILLRAAKHDIRIIPKWIPSQQNGLADALSRFDTKTIANLCPHWQAPWSTMLLPRVS